MKSHRSSRGAGTTAVLALSVAFYAACGDADPPPSSTDSADGLTSCARLAETSARLDCYDKLAGRSGSSAPTTTDGAADPPQCSTPSTDASVDASTDASTSTDPDAGADAGGSLTCPAAGRQLWYAQGCCCTTGTPGELCGCTCVDVDKCTSGVFKYSPKNGDIDFCNVPASTPPVTPPPNYAHCASNGGSTIYYDSTKFVCNVTSTFNPK